MSTRVVKFFLNSISTRVLYKEDCSFAFVEAYIQVSILLSESLIVVAMITKQVLL